MNVTEYLDKVAYKDSMDICGDETIVWKSKFDDSFLTLEGMEDDVQFLVDREITVDLSFGTGYSPKDNKWYGWSHRAIHGFTIGSTCKKGNCHYKSITTKEAIEDALSFWSDDYHSNVTAGEIIDGEVYISWGYTSDTPNKDLHGTISGVWHILEMGKGEWTAETMEDAKIMAQDFSDGVS